MFDHRDIVFSLPDIFLFVMFIVANCAIWREMYRDYVLYTSEKAIIDLQIAENDRQNPFAQYKSLASSVKKVNRGHNDICHTEDRIKESHCEIASRSVKYNREAYSYLDLRQSYGM
jgi:hypothetical protein